MSSFGDRLRRFRQAKRFSLDDLASKASVSRAYLWKLERKPDVNPSLELLQKLAKALDTTIADLAAPTSLEAPEIPSSLRACQEQHGLPDDEIADLARIRFRGGHPTDKDDWYLLYLQLKRTVGERAE